MRKTATAAKAPVKGSSINSPSRRKRRELRARNPRTYYATDKQGVTLFRFASHPARLHAIKNEALVPIGALDFRNKLAEDVENKLKLVDRRSDVAPAITQPSMPHSGVDPTQLATAIAAALQSLGVTGVPANLTGEQPRGTRVGANH